MIASPMILTKKGLKFMETTALLRRVGIAAESPNNLRMTPSIVLRNNTTVTPIPVAFQDNTEKILCQYNFTVQNAPMIFALNLSLQHAVGYDIRCNASPLTPQMLQSVTGDAGIYDITELLKDGVNTITCSIDTLAAHTPLPVIELSGLFAADASRDGFILTMPRALTLSSVREQGYAFYEGSIRYRYAYECKFPPAYAVLKLETDDTCDITLSVNPATPILPQNGCFSMEAQLQEGTNTLDLRLSPKHLPQAPTYPAPLPALGLRQDPVLFVATAEPSV